MGEERTFRRGDLVTRKSYANDLIFSVESTGVDHRGLRIATLKGLGVRLLADAPLSDLQLADERAIMQHKRQMMRECSERLRCVQTRRIMEGNNRRRQGNRRTRSSTDDVPELYEQPGKVLHMDADESYLKDCLKYYRDLKVPVVGKHLEPREQAAQVVELLKRHAPDILVVTGHDSLKKKNDPDSIDSYWNSRHYVECVRKAREHEIDKDGLIVIAGACQSHYEALMEAGANYASSPQRVLIHCFDPVLLAEKAAYTPIDAVVRIEDAIENTITKRPGLGGVETRGKMRIGMPKQ